MEAYEGLLHDRAPTLGLISPADLPRVRGRHILDSLRARAAFRGEDRDAADIGSGAGLPGLALAIALPAVRFVLVEPRRARAGFLELAVERLHLSNVEVFVGRAQELQMDFDVATARAFAPIDEAWRAAAPILRPGGRLIYFAGSAEAAALARSLVAPQAPSAVEIQGGIANRLPLVIMARG